MSTVTYEHQYIQAMKFLLDGALKTSSTNSVVRTVEDGISKSIRVAGDRTGTGRISTFGAQFVAPINDGQLPLLKSKYVHLKSIVHELIWMLRGDSNINYLKENGVRIWDEWADENGELGPVYGQQWRAWVDQDGNKIDQLENLLKGLVEKPFDTGHILTAWNVGELGKMALRPCHTLAQFYVTEENRDGHANVASYKLSCQLYQRSADMFLGVPFNAVFYSLLTQWIAAWLQNKTGAKWDADSFVHTFGDMHIYKNHLAQVALQIQNYETKKLSFAPLVRVGWYQSIVSDNPADELVPDYNSLKKEYWEDYAESAMRIAGKVSV